MNREMPERERIIAAEKLLPEYIARMDRLIGADEKGLVVWYQMRTEAAVDLYNALGTVLKGDDRQWQEKPRPHKKGGRRDGTAGRPK